MPQLTFVFGPNNTFFFDCPKSWKFHNIPASLRSLMNASMSPAYRIAQPYCLALGPQNNSAEPIWYIGCKVCDGQEKIFYSQNTFDINYPDLSRWIKTIPNAPRQCVITFGPALSFFACAPGLGSIWAGIPGDLSDKVQKAFDTPCNVSLGMNNAWFVMWPDGYYAWKFYGGYATLDKILDAAEPRSVSYLAVSPYNADQYFVAFKDRTVKYNLSPEWMPQMQEVFREWQVEIMQKQMEMMQKAGFRQPQQPQQPQQPYRHSIAGQYPPQPTQPQWNPNPYPTSPASPTPSYLNPSTPNTPLPAYSNPVTPGFSLYSPYGDQPPDKTPEVMNGAMFAPQGPPPRSASTEKRKSFLSKRMSHSAAPVAGAVGAKAAITMATEGSQTCAVM
ncbi:uncharacterized protein BDR25DRAFT_317004 [Lindgomyces ingoldianus]|uniref:Uncharacterized protein n=1 Tax=Lindgomyces ingoldianus TaxID=673940 RepID=A0ACB6QLR7_9PLEO|nr:uncharacterized protein BDR25DRAFT_317004 [Lindgomyces ingoldianus]KAF2467247.1 hypothetical protein BDR25DRAFT_317004 [Lindgomyces ingoldianus]